MKCTKYFILNNVSFGIRDIKSGSAHFLTVKATDFLIFNSYPHWLFLNDRANSHFHVIAHDK